MIILQWFVFIYVVLTLLSVIGFTGCFLKILNNSEDIVKLEQITGLKVSFPMVLFSLLISIFIWPYILYSIFKGKIS